MQEPKHPCELHSGEGIEEGLQMFSDFSDGKLVFHLSAQASAIIVLVDSIGRMITKHSAAGALERARGATEAIQKAAEHYRACREIAERRGLSQEWRNMEDAMRRDPRAAHTLGALEHIEAIEVMGDIIEALRQYGAVSKAEPSKNPRQN